MTPRYPTVKFNLPGMRRRAVLYEDYLALEGTGMLGVSEDLGQAYFDEVYYVFRYQATDWPVAAVGVLGAMIFLIGLIFQIADAPVMDLIGLGLMILGSSGILYSLFRLIFVKRLIVRVVSPRGMIEFRGDRPRSRDPYKDARKFFEMFVSKLQVVAAVAPEVPPPPPPPPAADVQ